MSDNDLYKLWTKGGKPTTELNTPHPDIGFLCNCAWEPGHDCAEARKPTNAPTSAKEK